MLQKLKFFFTLFRQGEEVADPKFWKDKQNAANKLAALIGTLLIGAKLFGYDIPLSTDEVAAVGLVVAAIGNWVFTIITSKKVGLPSVEPAEPVPVDEPAAAAPEVQPKREADIDESLYRG
jgi:hypothetical protein